MPYKGFFIDHVKHLDMFRITKLGNPFDTIVNLDCEDYPTYNAAEKYIDQHLI